VIAPAPFLRCRAARRRRNGGSDERAESATRANRGDLALPLLREPAVSQAKLPEAKFRPETSLPIKTNLPPDLAAALADLGSLVEAAERTA